MKLVGKTVLDPEIPRSVKVSEQFRFGPKCPIMLRIECEGLAYYIRRTDVEREVKAGRLKILS